MNGYFIEPAARQRLLTEASSWIGTPFAPHARVKGAGVDCVNLCAGIYLAAGFLAGFNSPRYSIDGGLHGAKSQLVAWLEADPQFARAADEPDVGDLLVFRLRGVEHHAGIKLLGGHFMHCLAGRKVTLSSLKDPTYARLFTSAWRPLVPPADR